MTDELNLYRAVQAARADIAEGIEQSTAVRDAAKRYNVPISTVTAYVTTALAGCRKAALELNA